MSQHSFTIPNLTAPQVRAQINLALQALASVSSGSTQPPVTFAGMFWLDTSPSPPVLRVRNAANNGWIEVGQLSATGMNIGGRVPQVVSTTPPSSPTPGMQWVDTSQSPAVVRVRNGGNTGWITIAPLPDVLLRDGSLPMTGRLDLAAGASGGLAFAGDTGTGLVRDAANTLRLRTNGSNRMTLTNTGITAHVPVTVPTATAAEHAVRWEQVEHGATSGFITLSGTAVDITGIPDGMTSIELWLRNVDLSDGTSHLLVQAGAGTTPNTTGYTSVGHAAVGTGTWVSSTSGVVLVRQSNVRIYTAQIVFQRRVPGATTWLVAFTGSAVETAPLSGALSQVGGSSHFILSHINMFRITSSTGTPTLSGSALVRWRR